jgi:hypothetical protein
VTFRTSIPLLTSTSLTSAKRYDVEMTFFRIIMEELTDDSRALITY